MASKIKSTGKLLGKALKGTGKAIDAGSAPLRSVGNVLGDVSFSAGKGAAKYMKNNTLKDTRHGRRADNLFTGKKLTGQATAAIGTVGLGVGLYSTANSEIKASSPRRVGSVEVGAAPMMEADGSSNLSNLNATGDMVFGMHNSRRG